MNKKTLSESDICDKFVRPAMESAGWDGMSQIYREYPLRAGRVVVRGRKSRRDAVSHDPDELLRDYAKLQREAQGLRNQLKAILAESLTGARA